MNTPSNATPSNANPSGVTPSGVAPSGVAPSKPVPESPVGSQAMAPVVISAIRPIYWSIRRELWENRSIYIAPLAAAVVFLFANLIHTIIVRRRMHGVWPLSPTQQHEVLAIPYELAGALIMGAAFIVGVFYSLDALYGERRDRSILFWKSLPVSDLTTVLSKLTVPIVILPLLSFAITVATQFIMLLMSSVILLGSGLNVATLWTQSSFFHVSLLLLYHIVTVHGLWYAPFYGWLLLVSAWAPRAPILWAFLPPFVICGVEKIAFNTTHFLIMLKDRLTGPEAATPPGSSMMDVMAALTPAKFFSTPGLWIGLAIAATFLTAAVRLRRYRGPI
jgi:ABC-2 type transport system permease protein